MDDKKKEMEGAVSFPRKKNNDVFASTPASRADSNASSVDDEEMNRVVREFQKDAAKLNQGPRRRLSGDGFDLRRGSSVDTDGLVEELDGLLEGSPSKTPSPFRRLSFVAGGEEMKMTDEAFLLAGKGEKGGNRK